MVPRRSEDVEKSALSYLIGRSVCRLWRTTGQYHVNLRSQQFLLLAKQRDMLGIVCKRIKIWRQSEISSKMIHYNIIQIHIYNIYSHNGILAIKMNNLDLYVTASKTKLGKRVSCKLYTITFTYLYIISTNLHAF